MRQHISSHSNSLKAIIKSIFSKEKLNNNKAYMKSEGLERFNKNHTNKEINMKTNTNETKPLFSENTWKVITSIIGITIASICGYIAYNVAIMNYKYDSIEKTQTEIKTDIRDFNNNINNRMDKLFELLAEKKSK